MKKSFSDKGITLIALSVTVVLLLIIASVTISTIASNNGIIQKMKESRNEYIDDANQKNADLNRLDNNLNEGFDETRKVNKPRLSKGMIPIKWNGSNWVVTDENDSNWFDYSEKKWANVMLSDGTYKEGTVQVGQVVQENELGSMFVWIPRYAYKMNYANAANKTKGSIDITFLKGTTNKDKNENVYQKDSNSVDTSVTKIVHPGFTIGDRELTGLWVAKFEASATNSQGKAIGNRNKKQDGTFEALATKDENSIVRSLPTKISWRDITIGEAEYQSMLIAGVNREKYGVENIDSHLIKNSEWGAVAYMCYSQYGSVPKINGNGNSTGIHYDLYTGMGPSSASAEGSYGSTEENLASHKYDQTLGKLASTTGDVTGVYDLAGGSWELVAAYLDSRHNNLNSNGKNSVGNIKFFENGRINSNYAKYFDKYEMSDEFKQATVNIDGTIVNVSELSQSNENTVTMAHHKGRQLLTQSVWNRLPHGIGMTEVSNVFSFYGAYKTSSNTYTWGWFKTAEQANAGTVSYATSWDSDYTLMVGTPASAPFVIRGGFYTNGAHSGVFFSHLAYGSAGTHYGFRPVLLV